MIEKVKEKLNTPITWSSSAKACIIVLAIEGICYVGYKIYEFHQRRSFKEILDEMLSEEEKEA
jgi:hypothetical protein